MQDEEYPKITKRYMQFVLRRYRRQAGMTQEELAGFAGISTGFLSMMEIGRRWPNVDMFIRLALAMNVRPEEMMKALMEEWQKSLEKYPDG